MRWTPLVALSICLGCSSPPASDDETPPAPEKAPGANPSSEAESPPDAKNDGERPSVFPTPGSETPSYLVDVHNFAEVPCEYTLATGDGFPEGDVPVLTLESLFEGKLRMYAGEMLYLRPVGQDRFGSGAGDPDKDGSAIVVHDACKGVSMADAGYTDAALAALRPHRLEACCTKCEGLCEGCSIPEGDIECTAEQTIDARCTLYEDIMDCRSVESLEKPGLRLIGQ